MANEAIAERPKQKLRLDTLRRLCDILDECEATLKRTKGDTNAAEPFIERANEIAYRGSRDLANAVSRAHEAIIAEELDEDDDAVCGSCGAPCIECGRAIPVPSENPMHALRDAQLVANRELAASEREALELMSCA